DLADGHDAAVADTDVGADARTSTSVDDGAAGDQYVEHGAPPGCGKPIVSDAPSGGIGHSDAVEAGLGVNDAGHVEHEERGVAARAVGVGVRHQPLAA